MNSLEEQQRKALAAYKAAKAQCLAIPTEDHWIKFCGCKRTCMLLGCRI